ncbi:hypothetical protein [Actibacterium ureilyticum]|uniref:hypothetical protein n=1 Tax=Actibacterium ureilyticum TaxID=1590614 RepID=UPI000BAAB7D9|nr:hypothetical protein [Actibacterium ureilyticum]
MAGLDGLSKILLKDASEGDGSVSAAGKALARSNPIVRLAGGFAQIADKAYMSPEHCYLYLARRVATAELAAARAGWIGGRLYNRLSGTRADYVPLSGAVVSGILRLAGEAPPEAMDRGAQYLVRRDVARDYLERAGDWARQTGLVS